LDNGGVGEASESLGAAYSFFYPMEEFRGFVTGFIEEHGVEGGKVWDIPHGLIHLFGGFALDLPRFAYHPLGEELLEGKGHRFGVAGINGDHLVGVEVGEAAMERFNSLPTE